MVDWHSEANNPKRTSRLITHQSSHAIFVREQAEQAFPPVDEVPDVLATRLISIRAFNKLMQKTASVLVSFMKKGFYPS